jgi:hypothetical protein
VTLPPAPGEARPAGSETGPYEGEKGFALQGTAPGVGWHKLLDDWAEQARRRRPRSEESPRARRKTWLRHGG